VGLMATLTAQLRNLFARELEVPERREPGAVSMRAVDVSVDRGQRRVLQSVSLDVRVGEVLALVGPNGAGKSTLLAAMAGDQDIAAGHVELDGRPLDRWTGTDMAQRRAVLPQQHTVGFSFTSLEVVRMGRAPWVRTACRDEDADAVREAMEACDVARFAERPFAALSGGERSRVALARVFAQRTETLLLDEPTAALDSASAVAVEELVRALAARGLGVLMVTHDEAQAERVADRRVEL
jgi:iron complex transport system ATP-binding protein